MTLGGSSISAVQQLMATLVASKPGGRIAELGTAFGEGASAMLAELDADSTLVTVEADPERFEIARKKLAGTRADVILGDWREVLPELPPFDLIFLDAGDPAQSAPLAVSMLARGGILIKDDLTPGRPVKGDPVREALFNDSRLVVSEIQTTPTTAAMIAVLRNV